MPKKAGIALIVIGAVLIVSALLLLHRNEAQAQQAGQEAELLLADVQAVIAQKTRAERTTEPEETTELPQETQESPTNEAPTTSHIPKDLIEIETLDPQMPVEVVGGYECIGFLTFVEEGLELPVMADWDYYQLNVAPCRQFGSSRTDDLVIAAHNYSTHFQCLESMEPGDKVRFTDMEGIVNRYQLTELRTLNPEAVEEVQHSGHDLVLYTCTYGGANRIVAFFDREAGHG